ncbi:hypothetical protein [Gramella sp. MAR_2010_147]|uniref:hypothetical protein n=1 Tax=Gramella sp. MAR_2010_147 TaxID=1250205 RepID=UPI00087A4F15|nr:hypothetical protein [Gramella sp. MAR_2010_147]SDR92624.1 hypothetical protein SAMN04488553_1049 [Gramella sp. MAR_2010_147]
MKRILILMLLLVFCSLSSAQEEIYMTFEFMKVDNDQEQFYVETEDFWEKIHEQRVASGDIAGWDLWQLLPGGEDQGYQYLTVTVFDDPLKMMNASAGILESAKMAYPDLSDEEIENRVNLAGGSRDLAVRLFLKIADGINIDYQMKPGMVATLDLMNARDGNYEAYEKAETDIFKPLHQKMVDNGTKGDWRLLKVLLPQGTEVFASHITVNMFDNWEQYINSMSFEDDMVPDMEKKMADGLKTRDMKWVYLATLTKMVRKQ